MMFRLALFCTFFCLMVGSVPRVSADSWQAAIEHRPAGSQIALVVRPLDGGDLRIDYNSDLLLPPASTQKLLTALAAELGLGDGFRFATRLEGRGRTQGERWNGDLKLRFSGAPDLTRAQLGRLLDRLVGLGVRRIDGDLLLDGSVFDGYERAPGWPWDNLGVCYSAPASAFTVEHNCVQAGLGVSAATGEPARARLYLPPHQPILVEGEVAVVSPAEQQARLCELLLDRGPGNRYRLHGCVTSERRRRPLNFAVNDTAAYVTALIGQELDSRGLTLNGQIRALDEPDAKGWNLLAQVDSAPLPELLREMLQDSDNLYADNLLKTLGRVDGGSGSFALGVRELRRILERQAAIRLQPATLKDGSGLSRDNLLSAEQLAAVLGYLAEHPELSSYRALPVAGESGTLQYRRSLLQPPLRDNVRAKSGSLNGSSNLAGFMQAASGKRYLFVLLVSGIARGDAPATARRAFSEFERDLLESLYHRG